MILPVYLNLQKCKLCSVAEDIQNLQIEPGGGKLRGWGCTDDCVIVGLNPSHKRSENDKIWCNRRYKYFIDMICTHAKKRKIFYTNLVKCSIDGNKPTNEMFDNCIGHFFHDEIKQINSRFIISLGSEVHKILKKRGYDSYKIWHPSYVKRFKKYKEYEDQIVTMFKNV